jgi:hypothetical protein
VCAKPWEGHRARIRKHLDAIRQGKTEIHRDYDWILPLIGGHW